MATTLQQAGLPAMAPSPARRWPLGLTLLTVAAAGLVLASLLLALLYAPTESTMGHVQRLFYGHLASAWAGALAFLVTLVAGIGYLITRDLRWDSVAYSAVEVGLTLVTIALVEGMTWGQYTWGVPWTWDPKLTAFAVMWLSYAAALMLRQALEDPGRRARFGAVYGIVAFAGVIFAYYGVRWIEATIHPYVIGEAASTSDSDFGMSSRMVTVLLFNLASYTVLLVTLLWHRVRLDRLQTSVENAKAQLFAGEA